jgi:predicted DNA-binding transcriptional regulator YafY
MENGKRQQFDDLGTVTFVYKNHRGDIRERVIIPDAIEFISVSNFGYQPGWYLSGYCMDKCARRSFNLAHIIFPENKTQYVHKTSPILLRLMPATWLVPPSHEALAKHFNWKMDQSQQDQHHVSAQTPEQPATVHGSEHSQDDACD